MAGFNELLHPRAVKGTPDAGEFVDVLGKLAELGAKWNDGSKTWHVPKARSPELDELLRSIGVTPLRIPEGHRVASVSDRERLKVPPAWTNVTVSASPDAKLLATGTDQKGRTQRLYSKTHSDAQAAEKFARVKGLADVIRNVDDALDDESDFDDSAAAMMLVRKLGMRPGSDRDTKADKKAYGASNIERRHVTVSGDVVKLAFTGKKGVDITLEVEDSQLASMLEQRLDGPPNGRLFDTDEVKMRGWLGRHAPGFKPKDFRTHLATATAFMLVSQMSPPATAKEFKSMRNQIGDAVASLLGNSRTMALGSYIDPAAFGPWGDFA